MSPVHDQIGHTPLGCVDYAETLQIITNELYLLGREKGNWNRISGFC